MADYSYSSIAWLSQNKYTIIDNEDYDLVNSLTKCVSSHGYAIVTFNGKQVYLHRLLLNASKDHLCDHLNRTRLDNRKANLMLCDYRQNNRNSSRRRDNTSGYKGVFLNKQGKYTASIRVNKKLVFLGNYLTAIEASDVYEQAAKVYHSAS